MSGLICAPQIIFASELNCSPTVDIIALASSRDISFPPIIFIRAPMALETSTSNKGLVRAFSTAS